MKRDPSKSLGVAWTVLLTPDEEKYICEILEAEQLEKNGTGLKTLLLDLLEEPEPNSEIEKLKPLVHSGLDWLAGRLKKRFSI